MPRAKPGTGGYPAVSPRLRYASGQPAQREVIDAESPTLIQRLKAEVLPIARDNRLASKLGIYHLRGLITETECEAGFRYAQVVGAYDRLKGTPRRTAKSQSYEFGFGGETDLNLEMLERMDPETASKIKDKRLRRLRKAEKAFNRVTATIPGLPIHIDTVVNAVCLSDEDIHSSYIPVLRAQLQRFMVHFGHAANARKAAKQPRRTAKGDARLMATATCEAMHNWFAGEKAQIQAFDVTAGKHKSSRLYCVGIGPDLKTEVHHAIEVKLKGLLPAVVNAQLVKAAQAMGWHDTTDPAMRPAPKPPRAGGGKTLTINGGKA